jgi:hypothetical protein
LLTGVPLLAAWPSASPDGRAAACRFEFAGIRACALIQKEFDMNINTSNVPSPVTAALVPEANRLNFLPRHFGRLMLVFEREVFTQMGELCESYSGGFFDYYDLSNGGCFMALSQSEPLKIQVDGNGYEGTMSPEAAGIVVTLFALNRLSFRFPDLERFAERYYQLRDFASDHPEAGDIFAAID